MARFLGFRSWRCQAPQEPLHISGLELRVIEVLVKRIQAQFQAGRHFILLFKRIQAQFQAGRHFTLLLKRIQAQFQAGRHFTLLLPARSKV